MACGMTLQLKRILEPSEKAEELWESIRANQKPFVKLVQGRGGSAEEVITSLRIGRNAPAWLKERFQWITFLVEAIKEDCFTQM